MAKIVLLLLIALLFVTPAFAQNLTLQVAGSENLQDTWINAGSVNQNNGGDTTLTFSAQAGSEKNILIKFNSSVIPSGKYIQDAQLCLYLNSNPIAVSNAIVLSANHLFVNYTCGGVSWNESCPTWNLRPTASYYNSTPESTYNFTLASALTWYCFNVTNAVRRSYGLGFNNVSFYMTSSIGAGTGSNLPTIRSKEHATASTRPLLNITYVSDDPPRYSDISTNSTGISGETVRHFVRWNDTDFGITGYIFSWNNSGSFVNDSFVNQTGSLIWSNVTKAVSSVGQTNCWKVWAFDEHNHTNVTGENCYSFANYSNATLSYPSMINESGTYRVVVNYTDALGVHIPNATVGLCYGDVPDCYNATENATNYYYYDFIYAGEVAGFIPFNYTASKVGYATRTGSFTIALFNYNVTIRMWKDIEKTQPYINNFMWVYAKPDCSHYSNFPYLFDLFCENLTFHGRYSNGSASFLIMSPNEYEFWLVDGSVTWSDDFSMPNVVKHTNWQMIDQFDISGVGVQSYDYFVNTTLDKGYTLFNDPTWNFWLSVVGLLALFGVATFFAYISNNAIATLFAILIAYIILKIFGILTGAIFFGLF